MTDAHESTGDVDEAHDAELEAFWADVRTRANTNRLEAVVGANPRSAVRPPAWSFSADPAVADRMLAELLAGRRTAVTSALGGADEVTPPEPGDLAIVLDGAGHPRALVRTVRVESVAYGDVDDATARADGSADAQLWRAENAAALTESLAPTELADDTPVLVEHLQRVYPRRAEQA